MKIQEISNPDWGRCFGRISGALHKHFPSNTEWTNDNPDIKLVHLLGQSELDIVNKMDTLDNVVLNQVNFLTSELPDTTWIEIWKKAKLVISFIDLKAMYPDVEFNFHKFPMGAEPELFPISKVQRFYDIFTTGHVAKTECLQEVYDACVLSRKVMLHTGENFKWKGPNYQFLEYMTDSVYSSILQRVKYITGLRITEGFEMACIEGAMTGAVPIVPFLPTYEYYKDFGRFIFMDGDITGQLVKIFSEPYVPLTKEQIEYVRYEFAWKKICEDLYKRLIYD
jgi:hypothetical protein